MLGHVPVDPLDYELIRLAYLSQQEATAKLQERYTVVQQQLARMAEKAGVRLEDYTFSLDTHMFEPIPKPTTIEKAPVEEAKTDAALSNVVDFPTTS
jgi:hypothetical protein